MPSRDTPVSPITSAFVAGKAALMRYVGRLNNTVDIEDVVQEAYLRAFKKEHSEPIENPNAYLFEVARNVTLNIARSASRRPTDYLDDIDEIDTTASANTVYDKLVAEELIGLHCAAIATLPKRCREVYALKKIYGYTRSEISAKLGISISTVDGHLTRGYAHCDDYMRRKITPNLSSARVPTGSKNRRIL